MKERPIIFSAPMVRAILDGRKTQTRRIVKPQPLAVAAPFHPEPRGGNRWVWMARDDAPGYSYATADFRCPCGAPSDRLWVKETGWERPPRTVRMMREGADTWKPYYYDADGWSDVDHDDFRLWGFKRRTSIHMPRWASRITLEIVAVRVERVQEISEKDALAEGALEFDSPTTFVDHGMQSIYLPSMGYARASFMRLWDSINAKRAPWDSNPWVWVIEFRRAGE